MRKIPLKILIIFLIIVALSFVAFEIRKGIAIQYEENLDTVSNVEKKVFSNKEFSFFYPDSFILETGTFFALGHLEPSVVRISIPQNYFGRIKSNFLGGYMIVSKSSKNFSTSACLNFEDVPDYPNEEAQTRKIEDLVFRVKPTTGAAAGNFYESRLFRIFRAGACYEIALVVHTANMGVYPEGTVQPFDSTRAFASLEKVARTFRFIDPSLTN